jgi:hypothetical protein
VCTLYTCVYNVQSANPPVADRGVENDSKGNRCCVSTPPFRDRLMVDCKVLALEVEVRILIAEPAGLAANKLKGEYQVT